VQASNYGAANTMALLLLVFCFAVLTMVYGLNRKTLGQGSWIVKSLGSSRISDHRFGE
jgi:hypothetical protein